MEEFTMLKEGRANQCRQNAQLKSQRKRQSVLDAIALLQQQDVPITRTAIVKQANVSYPFLSKHADLLAAIDAAAEFDRAKRATNASERRGKDIAIASMQRQMEKLKQQVREKDAEIRRKQQEIDQLYGKLASHSELTDAEIRRKLTEVLNQLQVYRDKEHSTS